jgi:hypothetical protein
MAHDFILGETGHNWSRGYSVLLPKTSDSTSMEEKEDGDEGAKEFASKLQAASSPSELYALAREGNPGALAAIKSMVAKANAGDPQARHDALAVVTAQKNFAESARHHTAMGPATVLDKSEWQRRQANLRLQDDLLRSRSPMQGISKGIYSTDGHPNDEECEAAIEGGACERAALARARGWSSIGKSPTPAQLAAQARALARRNQAMAQAIAKANAARAAALASRKLPPAPPPVDPNLDPNSLTSYTPTYPYQTNPATTLATTLTASPDDPDSSGSMNDDELAVARDGGSCERSALARVRGW